MLAKRIMIASVVVLSGFVINGAWAVGAEALNGQVGQRKSISSTVRISSWFNTKTGDKKRMFLARSGEKISFTVICEGAEKYEWRVNKKVQKDTGKTFTWTVPDDKGIWEIHVRASKGNAEARNEWVVSTLKVSEAPDFFDYFTDGRFSNRRQTDPWGRRLPEWKVKHSWGIAPQAVRFMLEPGKEGEKCTYAITAPSTTAYGTWRFKFRFPMGYFIPPNGGSGPRTSLYYEFIGGSTGHAYRYNKVSDSHNYFYEVYYPGNVRLHMDEDSGFTQGRGWYTVTIIRRKDGWLQVYVSSIDDGWTFLQFRGYNPGGKDSTYVIMSLRRPLWDIFPMATVYVDAMEIYKDKYFYPEKSARFTRYIENWRYMNKPFIGANRDYLIELWKDFKVPEITDGHIARINKRHHGYSISAKRLREWRGRELRWMGGTRPRTEGYNPVWGKGIVIRGRGVTLDDVARMVNNPSLFDYDKSKRTFTCYTDLVVDEGAELIIRNATLKMHCDTPGEHKLAVMYGATIKVKDATITSDTDNFFLWRFVGAANYGYNLGMWTGGLSALSYGQFGSVLMENCTVDNCAYFFLDSPRELYLKNVKFTRVHQADAGEYSASGNEPKKRKEFVRGKKAFCIFIKNYDIYGFDMSGLKFSAASSPVEIMFLLNSQKNRFNVYDSDFGKEIVTVRPSVKMMSFWNSRWPEWYRSELGMVNCRFSSIRIPQPRASAVPKYYLDVKVLSPAGKPVSGAKVTVKNEVDDRNYPAENKVLKYRYVRDNPELRPSNLYLGQPNRSCLTGTDGHTPSPSDVEHVVILPDFVQDMNGRKEFTYTITVEKDGIKKVITGVNPSRKWFRPDPEKPAYTITAVLDGKTISESELIKKGLAGPDK